MMNIKINKFLIYNLQKLIYIYKEIQFIEKFMINNILPIILGLLGLMALTLYI